MLLLKTPSLMIALHVHLFFNNYWGPFHCLTSSNFSKLGENLILCFRWLERKCEFCVLNHALLVLPFSFFLYLFMIMYLQKYEIFMTLEKDFFLKWRLKKALGVSPQVIYSTIDHCTISVVIFLL